MQAWLARLAFLALLVLAAHARADDLADFNAAVEKATAHQRVAVGYLRTGNIDLAEREVGRMRAAWGAVTSLKRPAALANDPQLYTTTMVDVTMRLVTATIMIESFRPEIARDSLNAIRAELYALRKANGIQVLADCIVDSNYAMQRLMTYDNAALDWNKPRLTDDISEKALQYYSELERCDAMAGEPIRSMPEFRRLIDGAQASLMKLPEAAQQRDADLLHRLLIELRSFDNLLAFRFG